MRFQNLAFSGLVVLLLSGCVAPYNDARREAGQRDPVGQSKNDIVAICYHPWRDDESSTRLVAEEICRQRTKQAQLKEIKHFNCSLMAPNTAIYTCE